MTRVLTIFCVIILSGLGSSSPAFSPTEQVDLQFKGQIVSAELQGVPLRLILERFEDEKGIWVKGDESVLEESISVRFDDLPLHEGLRRILSTMNHVLVFDKERGLVGLFILGKKDPGRQTPRDAGVVAEKSLPSQPGDKAMLSRDPFDDFPGGDHTGNAKTRSMGRTIGKDFSPLEDRDTQSGVKSSTDMPSTPESPFGESVASSPEDPFAASATSSSEGPFEKGVFPSSKDPFADSFDAFPESRGGRR